MTKIKIVVIVGPTAVGKTALGISLAKAFNGEIISGDSQQVYRQLDIGTAKATQEEQEAAVHHLIDIREVTESLIRPTILFKMLKKLFQTLLVVGNYQLL